MEKVISFMTSNERPQLIFFCEKAIEQEKNNKVLNMSFFILPSLGWFNLEKK